jgi:exodeoxyribonuclease V alpha subunit
MAQAVIKRLAIQLSLGQIQVLEGILSQRITIITGGPGTGKTTLIKSITAIFELLGMQILLAAPTGRAARRLSEVTRRTATTIHRLLGYRLSDSRFEKNQDAPLDIDVLVVDEASMVDLLLMYHLLNAVPVTAMLILVGDVFQLPAVGPGNVLSDLINTQRIQTFELKEIFRQSEKSLIVSNAHRIRRGEPPLLNIDYEAEHHAQFFFIQKNNPAEVVKTIIELCNKSVPERYSFDPVDEIQVLTPMHKGEVGTIHLNQMLQQILNPKPNLFEIYGARFKPGDKVMHLKNNYAKGVFNGDIGRICSIDPVNQNLSVDFDGDRKVEYDFTELDELTLAYAISVHKSQGSEYPAVIIPIMTQHFALLQRNLLYTGITRGKDLVVLVGTKKALAIALKNDTPRTRNSSLRRRFSGV